MNRSVTILRDGGNRLKNGLQNEAGKKFGEKGLNIMQDSV